jgi:hypothetical protein
MEHRPYPKIAFSTLKGRGADLVRVERALAASDKMDASVAWVATEKIHGAQLVVTTDGTTVAFGKRKAWLLAGEAFFWLAAPAARSGAGSSRHPPRARVSLRGPPVW